MRRQYGATGLMQHTNIPSDTVAAGSLIRRRAAGTLVATPPSFTRKREPPKPSGGAAMKPAPTRTMRTKAEADT